MRALQRSEVNMNLLQIILIVQGINFLYADNKVLSENVVLKMLKTDSLFFNRQIIHETAVLIDWKVI